MELKKLLIEFDKRYSEERIKKAEELHKEFLERFSREKLNDMDLEDYALGKTKTGSFCWWLEYNTTILGSIKGGNASKLIIYYSKKNGSWEYPSDKFDSVEAAWLKLKSDIIELINVYDKLPSEGIDKDSLLYTANMLKGKILYLYHKDKFLPIYQTSHLQKFLEVLNVPKSQWQGKDNIECNLLLKDAIMKEDIIKDWHPIKIANFFYSTFMTEERYYKISPGEDAVYWEECKNGGYISVGWNEIGDLKQYPDYEEFKNAFQKYDFHNSKNKNTEKANELWMFYNMKPGDKVIANKGKSKILGIGIVTEKGYEYRYDLNTQKHVVYVDWDQSIKEPIEIPKQDYWPMKTVVEITKKEFLEWTGRKEPANSKVLFTVEEEKFFARLESALERKGQCILYGPPGTGKTYLARKFIDWKNAEENIIKQKSFESKTKVWMMVASGSHNFKWEDILKNNGTVEFSLRNVKRNFYTARKGDKVVCYRGGSSDRAFVGLAEIAESFKNEKLAVKAIRPFKQEIHFDEIKDLIEYKTSQAGKLGNRGTMFEMNEDFIQVIQEMLMDRGDAEAARLLDESVERTNVDICTFHPSFSYEDFIEGFKPVTKGENQVAFEISDGIFRKLCNRAEENPNIPHYLIIDEINRGNVAKIFGEIITLLEKDKREVEVVLPQSKESFRIPGNVFIIATMNTSDRSIKMMDAALKRRFAFIECMPNYSIIDKEVEGLGISPATILKNINRKLIELGGRDKQIGHSYFMRDGEQINSVNELKKVYETEIIPLVQDYCFDDYNKLAEIVGEGFIDIDNMDINRYIFDEPDDVFISEINNHFRR